MEFNENSLYEGDFIEDSGYEGFTALYKKNPSITALVCANDEMATGAMVSARDHGIELLAQLSRIGYDNMFFTRHVYPL
ncbi:hypothetical protein LOC50_10385 [Pseudoalteromonas sp. SCSIO 43095]|uniref:hypothetical protein n=1 Tax=Pseudoalteromonas sp. SCSIO 43095 TaxID=2894202 RepID=UPI00202AFEC4|nr:hypothetical protein [Pseudoalteromonas sp. SCSIO 43095]URR00111.1 hypothetical protein LOC50_10385 [Pseudoalteromonas sp. SCSIO 43095]